jgi:ribose-phosphate pyrophosphokinase
MMIVDSIKQRGGSVESLVIPCVPGARQDRIKWEGDMLYTIKYVAEAINDQHFHRVVTVDPHSMATTALIDRLHVYPLDNVYRMVYSNAFPHWDSVIAPDKGAVNRAETFSSATRQMPVLYGSKHRDPETNKLSGFSVDGIEAGKHYLIVDDLCDAGGTFMGLGDVINHKGATADLYVTHGLFTKGTEKLSKVFKKIYSTDSWSIRHERVNYTSITRGMI